VVKATDRQEMEADVVVVGYGAAGATAAITAHDTGARVLFLEKMLTGGGNTLSPGARYSHQPRWSGSIFEALCFGTTEREIIGFVENALQTKDWVHQLGGEAAPRPRIWTRIIPPGPREQTILMSRRRTCLQVQY